MKKLRLLFLVAAISISGVFLLAGCGVKKDSDKSALDQIKENGKIRIGVFSDKPPFGFIDENGENQGFDIYIAKRFAKDLLGDESKVEFVLVEAASRVEYLETNKVDMILANFTVTDERKEKVDFANPYMKVALGVVSKDGKIVDLDSITDEKIIVNKGTTAETYLTKNYPNIELLKYDQNTEAFQALIDGRGAGLAHDNTMLFAWAKENQGFEVGVSSLGSIDTIAPAVQKGNTELLNWINEELTELGEENFMHEAYEETLFPAYGESIDREEIVVEGGKLD